MKRLTIIGLWPDDVVKYCTEKCDCRRYAFDRILYHRGGRDARERICIPVVDRSGAVTTYLDLPVLFLEANAVYLHLDDGSDIFLSNTQMLLIANEVERLRAEAAKTVPNEPQQAAPVVSTADKKAPPREACKLAPSRRDKGPHVPSLPEMQGRVCAVLARTADSSRVPEVRCENPSGRVGTVRVHLPGLQENELRPDEHRGRRNHKPEILLRLRPEHPEAHVEPGQALLYDVRRAG